MARDQSKSKAKKQRRKAKKVNIEGLPPEESGESLAWYKVPGGEKTQNLTALKLEILGPFLFCQPSLCDKAVVCAREHKFLPVGSPTWPMFFGREKWNDVRLIVNVTMATTKLCEENQVFCDQLMTLNFVEENIGTSSLCELIGLHSDAKLCSLGEIQTVFNMIVAQVLDFSARALHSSPGQELSKTSAHKDLLIGPIKDRGNGNYRQLRYKAAIADYTAAIKLCPYNALLYCNRALCYLRNKDYWYSCLDSYRALVLRPGWEKPYYRCAEALNKLGDHDTAISMNKIGVEACPESPDLLRQAAELSGPKLGSSPESAEKKASPSVSSEVRSGEKDKDLTNKSLSDSTVTNHSCESRDSAEKDSSWKGSSRTKGSVEMELSVKDESVNTVADTHPASNHTNERQAKSQDTSPFTNFEPLHYPEVSSQLSCKKLRRLCSQVKLRYFSPASYFAQDGAWEKLEPVWKPPPPPTTDPHEPHTPVPANLDEIWCPVLADMKESKEIKPTLFHYLADSKLPPSLERFIK